MTIPVSFSVWPRSPLPCAVLVSRPTRACAWSRLASRGGWLPETCGCSSHCYDVRLCQRCCCALGPLALRRCRPCSTGGHLVMLCYALTAAVARSLFPLTLRGCTHVVCPPTLPPHQRSSRRHVAAFPLAGVVHCDAMYRATIGLRVMALQPSVLCMSRSPPSPMRACALR